LKERSSTTPSRRLA